MKLPAEYDKLTAKQRRQAKIEYIVLQNKKCWYCRGNLYAPPPENILKFRIDLKWFPEGFLDTPIHLQHDHSSGLTEGAVHAYCNAVLWQYYAR